MWVKEFICQACHSSSQRTGTDTFFFKGIGNVYSSWKSKFLHKMSTKAVTDLASHSLDLSRQELDHNTECHQQRHGHHIKNGRDSESSSSLQRNHFVSPPTSLYSPSIPWLSSGWDAKTQRTGILSSHFSIIYLPCWCPIWKQSAQVQVEQACYTYFNW